MTLKTTSCRLQAAAKINLALEVVGRLPNGYHRLDMVMQSVDLYDYITLKLNGCQCVTMQSNQAQLPCDETNIAWRCAMLFFKEANIGKTNQGVHIVLDKHIPWQAGLGGGSADGAAVLYGLNYLHGAPFSLSELCEMGKQIGADIPFCLVGGTARVGGIGEQIIPLQALPDCAILLAKPAEGISTKDAFLAYDAVENPQKKSLEPIIEGLSKGELPAIGTGVWNALEQVCLVEEVPMLKRTMRSNGAVGVAMSGSGSCVFGLFATEAKARACMPLLRPYIDQLFFCLPVGQGVTLNTIV